MKQLLYIVLLLSCPAFAQREKDSIVINNRIYYAGETYLDSVKIKAILCLNPKNIKSIQNVYTKDNWINGCNRGRGAILFIDRKKRTPLGRLDEVVASVRKSNKISDTENIQLILDGDFVKKPDEYLIERNYIKKLEILVDSPETRNSHMGHTPTIIITTKSSKKKK